MANKSGEGFEKLTEDIYVRLIRYEKFEKVERNVKINGVDGERQIDILLTTYTMGLEIKTIVECKDYNKKVDVARIDAIDSKMKDVRASRAVVVSSRGFTSGAIRKLED